MGIKRLRFFRYFFTGAADWLAEQLYHRGRQKRHNKDVHGWGIASGLRIQATDPPSLSVTVPAGLALDPNGEELYVETSHTVDLTSVLPAEGSKTVYIALKYSEQETDEEYIEETGKYEATRIEEVTSIVLLESEPGSPYVEIGRIQLTADATAVTDAVDPNSPGSNEIDLRYTRTLQGGAADKYTDESVANHQHTGEAGQPDKINLTDGAEVQGKLPGSMVAGTVPNADTVDNIDASTSPEANKLLALNGDKKFPDSVLSKGMHRQKFDEVTSSFDWNSATKPGFYHGHSNINAPDGAATEKIVMVMTHDNDDIAQWMMDMNGNMFYRNCSAGTWGTWRKLWHSENDGAGSGLDADTLQGKKPTDFATNDHSHPSVSDQIPGFMTPYLLSHLRNISDFLATPFSGFFEEYTPNKTLQNSGDEYVSPQSGTYNSKLCIKLTARVEGNVFAGAYTQTVTVRWKIYYRKNGGNWTEWKTDSFSGSATSTLLFTERFSRSTERSYEIPVNASPDKYEIKVVHDGEWSSGGGYWGSREKDGTWVRVDEVKFIHKWPGADF